MANLNRRGFLCASIAAAATAIIPAHAFAQTADPFRLVEPAGAAGDKPSTWTLHFRYAPPRIITVDLPKVGKKTIWYMVYQVYNTTPNPQSVTSLRMELVTKDLNTTHLDEPQPALFRAVAEKEDKEKVMKFLSTIQMTENPIPVTKPDSFPRYVSGLAIWTDVPERAGKTNQFSVYVSGLSDGLIAEPAPSGGQIVKIKTLQLDFFKPTDTIKPGIDDIRAEDNNGLGGEKWIYRAASLRKAAGAPMPK